MSDIFISYASDDRERIMPLVRALEDTSWSVFWDRTIPTGKHWRQVIGKEIRDCRSIIVVWSKTSVDSDYVQEEAEEGKQRGILFPVMIDDVLPPFGFSGIQAQNLTDWDGAVPFPAYDRLVNDIVTLLGPPIVPEEERMGKGEEQKGKKEEERTGFEESKSVESSEEKEKTKQLSQPTEDDQVISELYKETIMADSSAELRKILYKLEEYLALRPLSPEGRELKYKIQKAIERAEAYETPKPSMHAKLRKTPWSRRLILASTVIFICLFAVVTVFQIMRTSSRKNFYIRFEIPPGGFLYGEDRVKEIISAPFLIDIYPVTNSQYKKFIANGGYDNDDYWSEAGKEWRQNNKVTQPKYWDNAQWNRPDHPVVGVSYFEAEAFAKWAGKRLPTEQEWERAARGTDGRQYPWGNIFDKERCNTRESGIEKTSRVDRYPEGRSPSGCYDMAGNVWEWTRSWYEDKNEARVLRGGSWVGDSNKARCAIRIRNFPQYRADDVGFRCVSDKK